ncbi:hypothetical protein [Flavobacterium sp.]|uniref:hypothetical protein n=1 Tax=Flavobacterium sp. TaxID=239 RepID=UPI0025C07139|nr:hypothetical protein [Flavobacterium sp.]MBA4275644.1 hypothetical protein [Flavobacterium sp.]
MKEKSVAKKVLFACLLFGMLMTTNVFAQVGIGTVTPDESSILDITSTTQGLLTPRMTTAQRNAIVTPADGLMVYDTELKSFYHYNSTTTSWNRMSSDANGRLKFKRIKSTDVLATVLADEKAAGGGSKYLLDTSTLYEINGTVNVDFPIELNNAYLVGLDSGEDKLVKASGDLFTGTTGGSIRVLTLTATAGKVFNITGGGTQNLIFRDAVVASSSNVGVIDNFALVFISIVQYVANTTGIIYKDVNKLLISNAGWFGNNLGTYETLQGTFGLVEKTGGFTEVAGANIGFDVSSNPTINVDAVVRDVVFMGTLTTGKYVNGYNPSIYSGYNFNNKWNVNCSGIPVEADAAATGDVNFDYAVGSGALTSTSGTAVKLAGNTTSNNLFRFSTGATNNKLIYLGTKKRYFRTTATFSFQSSLSAAGVFVFYLAKNGAVINQSKVYCGVTSSDVDAATILSTVEMSTNDYIEVWVSRYSGSGDVKTVSLNLVVN